MADFDAALLELLKDEGGYSNRPEDRGGETIFGISRKNWPDWEGWDVVDSYDNMSDVTNDPRLTQLTEDLYREEFWEKCGAADSPSQKAAFAVFTVAVNSGVGNAGSALQNALNTFATSPIGHPLYSKLTVDGIAGPNTKNTLGYFFARYPVSVPECGELLCWAVLAPQTNRYMSIVENDVSQSANVRGWFKRMMGIWRDSE